MVKSGKPFDANLALGGVSIQDGILYFQNPGIGCHVSAMVEKKAAHIPVGRYSSQGKGASHRSGDSLLETRQSAEPCFTAW
jgi:hypothetical protein